MKKDDTVFYVYYYRNLINNKLYVGKGHGDRAFLLGSNRKNCRLFYRALLKYKEHSFELTFLETGISEYESFELEKHYILTLNSKAPNGYNLTNGGEGSAGLKFTEESIQRLRIAKLGKSLTEEHKQKLRDKNLGKTLTLEHIEKLRIANTGKRHSEEFKTMCKQRDLSHLHTEEIIKKSAASRKLIPRNAPTSLTTEHRANISKGLTGRPVSDTTKEKLRDKALTRTISQETRAKMYLTRKQRWEAKKKAKEESNEEN